MGFGSAIERGINRLIPATGILSLKGLWVIDWTRKGQKARESWEIQDIRGRVYKTNHISHSEYTCLAVVSFE